MATEVELLQKFVAKVVIKNKMITVAGQLFIENEKKIDNSNRIFKRHEIHIGDNKIGNDILRKICGDNVKGICSEKDEIQKNNFINYFLTFQIIKKREMLSNKYLLGKKVSIKIS